MAVAVVAILLVAGFGVAYAAGLFNKTSDKEINLIAKVNTEGSGIYLDDKFEDADFVTIDGTKATFHAAAWGGKVFGTPGSTSIQHMMLQDIVKNMGLKFSIYRQGSLLAPDTVYYEAGITNVAAWEGKTYLDGGIIWQPVYEAIIEDTSGKHPAQGMITTDLIDPNHTCCVIGASHAYTSSHGDETVRFLMSYVKSVDWVNAALDNKTGDDYKYLVQLAVKKTGQTESVVKAALDTVKYTYGMDAGDTVDKPLNSLIATEEKLVSSYYAMSDGPLKVKLDKLGFKGPTAESDFAKKFINGSYLADALKRNGTSNPSNVEIKVGVIAGDVHQIALHLGVAKGFFTDNGITLKVSESPNGSGVVTSIQNGAADFGLMGAPPITITVINGELVKA